MILSNLPAIWAVPQNNGRQQETYSLYWPPQLNNYYPDLNLLATTGQRVKLSSYVGKILVIEPIGMSCPACQAWAGANRAGRRPYGNVQPQADLRSLDEMLAENGISTSDQRVVFVQLLLYNPQLQAPSLQEAQAWARNFGSDRGGNRIVLVGESNMIGNASYAMIPGFQLVDRDFILRSDATGHTPKHDLYRQLIPALKNMLRS